MHGLIFSALKKFVNTKASPEVWLEVCGQTKTSPIFLSFKNYQDEVLVQIVQALSDSLKIPIPKLLEDFGKFLMPELIEIYKSWVKPEWDSFAFLLNVEEVLHTAAKKMTISSADAPHPPVLDITKVSPNCLHLKYTSERKMCPLAKGMLNGMAAYYKEKLIIKEESCILRGDSCCLFSIVKTD